MAEDCDIWRKKDFSSRRVVHAWADGVHFNPRFVGDRQCKPVLIGADEYGEKDVLAVMDGFRGNSDSWRDLFAGLKARGVAPPELAVGDGAVGFRAALRDVQPETGEQRCRVHKAANVTGAMPKSLHDSARSDLHDI